MERKCPICMKAGLPDFYTTNTICPQCNSDLSVYRVVRNLSTSPQGYKRIVNSSLFVLIFGILVVSGLLLFKREMGLDNAQMKLELSQLNDTITTLKKQLDERIEQIDTLRAKNSFEYVIRPGDTLSELAVRFYNAETYYGKIAADNNISSPYLLRVGQKIKISFSF